MRTVYVLFSGAEIPVGKEGQEIMDLADLSTPLPEWFTEDLDVYAKRLPLPTPDAIQVRAVLSSIALRDTPCQWPNCTGQD